ncbi:hypothetical protein [Bacillus pumilus]|uniref:hypothetical protein n=1 Tax=Bacillus pumilus TaxID=1408 RepID=UPI000B12EE74|nr:hypothetical protein [Bacillus pumilus]MCY7574156.1 hypothetical protein [Bacillus pumilus]MEC3762717.1 hypothetical protein [Bacillus pumilus]
MASKFGVSANPKKANHTLGKDKVVVVAIQNHNDYICGPNLIPQRKVAAIRFQQVLEQARAVDSDLITKAIDRMGSIAFTGSRNK